MTTPLPLGPTGPVGDGERLDRALADAAAAQVRRRGGAWRRFRKNRLAMAGLVVIGLLILTAVLAPLIAPYDPVQDFDTDIRRQGPSADHWFGTDQIGRDVFSRVVHGARVSLRVGILSSMLAAVVGTVMGSLAGYFGRWVDSLIMRLTDIFLAFPYILVALAIVTVLGRGERTVIIVIGGLGWLAIARVLRSTILQVKELEYVEAARAMGYSHTRILVRHILPNSIQIVIVYATIGVGTAVLAEAALSYLGAGVRSPTPAWGLMVNEGRRYITTDPHLLLFPGGFIVLLVLSFLFVGDGLRDALDPRLR